MKYLKENIPTKELEREDGPDEELQCTWPTISVNTVTTLLFNGIYGERGRENIDSKPCIFERDVLEFIKENMANGITEDDKYDFIKNEFYNEDVTELSENGLRAILKRLNILEMRS